MITALDIKGFKSIKDVHLDCKRINLFIGEPNTGKSNILEALGFLSWCGHAGKLQDYVRIERMQDLFYDGMVEKGKWGIKVVNGGQVLIACEYVNGEYCFSRGDGNIFLKVNKPDQPGRQPNGLLQAPLNELNYLRFYRFKTIKKFESEDVGALLPPDGRNMVSLMYSSKTLRQLAGDYFSSSGLLFVVKPHEKEIEIQKQLEGVATSVPYHLSSDTLQRMIFYMTAIESNKDATLVFEEPEAHAFPYYTKHLGERIALDENKNQYFIATHNPYLLTAIWEKSTAGDVAVFATYYRDYETRVKPLTPEDMAWLFEADPFLGVSHLTEEAP